MRFSPNSYWILVGLSIHKMDLAGVKGRDMESVLINPMIYTFQGGNPMGKGDRRTKRGKIWRSSTGNSRRKKAKKAKEAK